VQRESTRAVMACPRQMQTAGSEEFPRMRSRLLLAFKLLQTDRAEEIIPFGNAPVRSADIDAVSIDRKANDLRRRRLPGPLHEAQDALA